MVGAALSSENWKLTTPHVAIDAAGRSSVVLPIDFSLSNSEFARHGNDLMIRSLDGVVIAVRGYFASGSHPKLIEYGGTESTTPLAELFTQEVLALDEELAQEELAQEELTKEELTQEGSTKKPLAEETSENIAAFVTDAGIAEESQGDSPPEFQVVDGDYTTALQSVPVAHAFATPPLNDGTRLDLTVTQTEPTRSLANAEVEPVPVPATSTLAPEPSQPEPEPIIVATEPTPELPPEPAPVPTTSTLAPEPTTPEPVPEPIVVATEPTPEPTSEAIPVPATSTLAPEPSQPEPEPIVVAPLLEPEQDEPADTDDDENDDSVVSGQNDSNRQDIADKDDDVDVSIDNDVKDSVFIFQHGDGKIKIDDFDLGDVIRFEGFNSEDIAIESKGNNVKISIVGDKHDSITLSHQHEQDSNSYSITQTDDGSVIVTLDSQ